MRKLLTILALGLLPSTALAIPALIFDTTPGGAGGTITYDGAGGPAVGTGIVFVDIVGQDTPANDGALLPCVGCSLAFSTGANTQEGPTNWVWDGGGSFVLTGTVPSIGINAPTALLTGSFTGTPNTPGLASAGATALFIAIGIDTKDPTLAGFFGLGPADWRFANTEIMLDTFTLGVDGAFSGVPNQADIINTTAVPTPSALGLLGLGLTGLALVRRRRA